MGPGLADLLQRAERQAIASVFLAANSLAGVSAVIDDPATHQASDVASSARDLRARAAEAHSNLVRITASHSPVAGDLRLVLALIELPHHCTLIANQFDLISEQLAELNPGTIDRAQNTERLSKMAAIASVQLRNATDAFRGRDLESARQLDRDDDELDALNRDICDTVAQLDTNAEERDLGFRHVLIARSLERIGDNAVDSGEQTAFLITARRTEFSDASQRAGAPPHPEPDRRPRASTPPCRPFVRAAPPAPNCARPTGSLRSTPAESFGVVTQPEGATNAAPSRGDARNTARFQYFSPPVRRPVPSRRCWRRA